MGINASSSFRSSDGLSVTNNLPPLLFHSTHGENIRLSRSGASARRSESFCKGITFSNRAVKINEKVVIKFVETSSSWSGVLRFGFTSNDPNNLRGSLPKYACPDFTNKPGYWAKALAERYASQDTVLFYYVNSTGDVYFGINGEEKGVFFNGVDTRGPLWALIDIYGNTVAVEFIDSRIHSNNSSARNESVSVVNLIDSLESLTLNRASNELNVTYNYNILFLPLPFHSFHGKNIQLSSDNTIAARNDSEFSSGYVFTSSPLKLQERIVIQILETESMYVGALAFGLTSCDPSLLTSTDLPEDSDLLLDRPEYWVVNKDVANSPQRGDELSFSVTRNGEVLFIKNHNPPVTLMHVDQTLHLWAFFDVYGNTLKIRTLGSTSSPFPCISRNQLRVMLPPDASSYDMPVVDSSLPSESTDDLEGTIDNANNECAICYERAIDSVLYTCGHMCMCYECAYQLWQKHDGGHCPICRAEITDVIRTYRS